MDKLKNSFLNILEGLYERISINPILETIIKNIIQKYVGQYVDIDKFQLKSLKDVKLENVNLKKDEINRVFLQKSPFFMTYGMIGEMKIKIPIQELLTKPSSIEINKVEIHLRPNGNNISHTYFEKWYKDLLDQQEQQKKQNLKGEIKDNQYDPDKMNELKTLLLQVALNIKAHIKNVIIKVYLQPEMSQSAEEVYFMLRISEIINIDENKRQSQIGGDQVNMFESSLYQPIDKSNLPNIPTLQKQNTHELNSSINQTVNMKISNINLFILKDSSLNSKEYSHLSTSSRSIGTEELKFPFTYPQHNHPTNILHIAEIQTTVYYPLNVHNDKQEIQLIVNMHSFEVMVEPYQIKLIGKMLDIVSSWKKQIASLKLLLFTKDQNMKNLIIENNKKWTQQCDFFNSLESSIKNSFYQNHSPENIIKDNEDDNMDQFLYKTLAEFPSIKKNLSKKETKQLSTQNNNNNPNSQYNQIQSQSNNIQDQQNNNQGQQNNNNFFNKSIMVHKIGQSNPKEKRSSENVDLDQSNYFNKSQLGKIIDPQMKDCIDDKKSCNQQSNSKTLSFKFYLNKCGIYILKGSEQNQSAQNSVEYSREWQYTKNQSIVSSILNEPVNTQSANFQQKVADKSDKRTYVNISIPCSYFMFKASKIEFNFSNEQNAKKIDFDAKSFKLLDVLLMKSNQNHYKFQHFDLSNKDHAINKNNSQVGTKENKLSSTFWKNKPNVQTENQEENSKNENKFLVKYQIEKTSHYCVNYIIYYIKENIASKKINENIKIHESVKIHYLLNNFWKMEKKEREDRKRDENNNPIIYQSMDSQFENNIRQTYPQEYASLKRSSTGTSQIFQNKNKQRQDQLNQTKPCLFSMVQKLSCAEQYQTQNSKAEVQDAPIFGGYSNEKNGDKNNKDQKDTNNDEKQPEDVYATINIDKVYINFEMKFLHDIALIQCPLAKYAHYSEDLYFDLDQKIPKFEVPHEIKKLLKTLNKDFLELDIKINMLSCNLLTYGFEDYFISSKEADNIYNNYAQWGCLCEVSQSNNAHKTYSPHENSKKNRGSYKPHYLNISIIKPEILVVSKKDLNINFNEINVFSCDFRPHGFHKIIHIGKNLVLTQKNGQNHFELTYPSILKYLHVKDSSKDVSLGKQSSFSNSEPENKLDIQNLPKTQQMQQKQDEENKQQEGDNEEREEQKQKQSKVKPSEKGNLPQDTFYKDDEQIPDINSVKTGLNIGIPVLEVYLLDDDLNTLGDIVFSLKTIMDVIDQFKYQSQKYKNFFENIKSKAILLRDNILIRTIVSEVNIYYKAKEGDCQNSSESQEGMSFQQKQQKIDSLQASQQLSFRQSNDSILQECLIFHMKDLSLELLLNKEIKKEQDIKNYKLTVKISLAINNFIIIDNTLPTFLGKNSNLSQRLFTFQGDFAQNPIQNESDIFPNNLNTFRVCSLFLKRINQENVLMYKMNLQGSTQHANQDLYNLMASRLDDVYKLNNSQFKNVGLNSLNKQMILAIRNIQERIVSADNQLSIQLVFKKKQHEQPFLYAQSKQQLDVRALSLSQSVISLIPFCQSNLILQFVEDLQKLLFYDKLNSDMMVKNEFKEILFRDFVLFRDVKIDIFASPCCHQYILFEQSITPDILKQIKGSQSSTIYDRYISPFRAIISIDKLNLINFNRREQRDCSLPIQLNADTTNLLDESSRDEHIKQLLFQQNGTKQIMESIDVRVNKISLEFLHQVDFNTAIDPFMIDFMFASTSDSVIAALGFSQLAILFDIELNKLHSQNTNLKIDGIQLSLFKDTAAHLKSFVETLIISMKSIQNLQSPFIDAIKLAKNRVDLKDKDVQLAIYKSKIDQSPCQLLFHPFYQQQIPQLAKSMFNRNKYMRQNSQFNTETFNLEEVKKQNEDEIDEESKDNVHQVLKSSSKRSSYFDESFEKIDGEDCVIDEESLQVKEKLEFNIQFITLYLYEGLDFNFKSINTFYNINPELFLKAYANKSIQSQDSKLIKQPIQSQPNNSNEDKKGLNILIDMNYTEQKQQQPPQSSILIVREKTQKKLSGNNLMFKMESMNFQMTSFKENEQNIEQHFNITINKLIGENKFQKYTTLSTEQLDVSDSSSFFNLQFFVENKTIKIETIHQYKMMVQKGIIQKQKENLNFTENLIIQNHIIKQVDLKVHQNIKVNLSSQGIEFLQKFFTESTKTHEENNQNIKDEFQLALNKNSVIRDQQQINNNKKLLIKKQNVPASNQKNQPKIENIITIEFLFIPKINIFISNKKEGFDFSRLSKKEGLLQIINIGELSGIEVTLVPISIYDQNIDVVGKLIIEKWKEEIIGNQKWQVISKLPLVKNIANIGDGIFNLFYMPISYYMQGMSVLDGTYQGVKNFVTNTTQESINLTNAVFSSLSSIIIHNAKNASYVFNQAKNYVFIFLYLFFSILF